MQTHTEPIREWGIPPIERIASVSFGESQAERRTAAL